MSRLLADTQWLAIAPVQCVGVGQSPLGRPARPAVRPPSLLVIRERPSKRPVRFHFPARLGRSRREQTAVGRLLHEPARLFCAAFPGVGRSKERNSLRCQLRKSNWQRDCCLVINWGIDFGLIVWKLFSVSFSLGDWVRTPWVQLHGNEALKVDTCLTLRFVQL